MYYVVLVELLVVPTYGLELRVVELQRLLKVVLGNSFSCLAVDYTTRYTGFLSVVQPAHRVPSLNYIVYKLKKESIYADAYYLTNPVRLFYGRYVDDSGSFATSKEAAIHSCSKDRDIQ